MVNVTGATTLTGANIFAFNAGSPHYVLLTSQGAVSLTDQLQSLVLDSTVNGDTLIGITEDSTAHAGQVVIDKPPGTSQAFNTYEVEATGTGATAIGFKAVSASSLSSLTINGTDQTHSDGLFLVTAAQTAIGAQMGSGAFTNEGFFEVDSQNAATGVLVTGTGSVTNTLQMHLMALNGVGVSFANAAGASFTNSADAILQADDLAGGTSTGISFGGAYVPGQWLTITNNGDLHADTAIQAVTGGSSTSIVHLTNTGTIEGDIHLGIGPSALGSAGSQITNNGQISGNVFLDTNGNDLYDSSAGAGSATAVYLGSGADTVHLGSAGGAVHVGAGTATITGTTGSMTVYGGIGSETVTGSSAADYLEAGAGNSTLTGGGGADTFAYLPGDGNATVTDFSAAQGDKIDLLGFSNLRSFNDVLAAAHQQGSNTVIDLGSNALTLTGVTLVDLAASDAILPAANHQSFDITGDGRADLIFRDAGTGDWGYAAMEGGSSFSWRDLGPSTPAYSVDGTGDFNGDGVSDVIFRNHATGDWGYAAMNTQGGFTWDSLGASTPSYSIDGTGDFNGDGVSDIIFRNDSTGDWGYAAMNRQGGFTWDALGASTPSYAIVGTGDFNGDGTSDILFRNNATGDWGYAAMNRQGGYTWDSLGPSTPSFSIDGTGDFNGDGTTDVLFRNHATGEWGYAAMNTQGGFSWVDMGPSTPSYSIVGTGDFNGDGTTDVVFRSAATGDWGYAAMHPDGTFTWIDMGPSNPAYFIA